MLNLLSNAIYIVLPIVFFAVFIAVAAAIFVSATKNARARQSYKDYRATHTTDKIQRRAENGQNRTQSQTTSGLDLSAHDHSHVGEDAEQYEKIVGSLGEIDDEGCDELDGVRLIAHDLVYEGDEETKDYSEAVKAMVLGDILNTPRCKGAYRRK